MSLYLTLKYTVSGRGFVSVTVSDTEIHCGRGFVSLYLTLKYTVSSRGFVSVTVSDTEIHCVW